MYYFLYKKQILILFIIILLGIIGSFLYKFILSNINPVKNIDVTFSGSNLEIKSNTIGFKSKYDFLQIYLYPNDFELNCQSNNETLCNNINSNLENISNVSLALKGIDLSNFKENTINILTDFGEEEQNNSLLSGIFYETFSGSKEVSATKTGYEKYFEFKKNDNDQDIYLNEMEIICAEQIVSSVIPGTFEEDKIIGERIQEKCSNFGEISAISLAYGGEKAIDDYVNLDLNIKSFKILFKYFNKDGDNYNLERTGESIINQTYNISSKVNVSELVGN